MNTGSSEATTEQGNRWSIVLYEYDTVLALSLTTRMSSFTYEQSSAYSTSAVPSSTDLDPLLPVLYFKITRGNKLSLRSRIGSPPPLALLVSASAYHHHLYLTYTSTCTEYISIQAQLDLVSSEP